MKAVSGFLFLCLNYTTFSQVPTNASSAPVRSAPPTYLRDVFSTHIDSKPYAGIQGSPFVDDKWLLSQVKLEGRREIIDSIQIRINVYSNSVHFFDENGEEVQMAVRVDQIKIIDNNSPLNNTVFLSNFDQERGFFKVVVDGGQLKLLKKLRIFIWENQPLGSEMQRRFEIQDDLYLANGSQLFKPSKSCVAIHDAFGKNEKMLDYIDANRLHCNKEEDLRKIVAYHATLK